MKRLTAVLTALAMFGLAGCGGDSEGSTGTKADMGDDSADDATDDDNPSDDDAADDATDDSTDDAADDTTDDAADDMADDDTDLPFAAPDIPDSITPPEDILPDVPPDTEVQDLDPDEFDELCETYLDGAENIFGNLQAFCGITAIGDAVDAMPETTEEFRELCADGREACEINAQAIETIFSVVECNQDNMCSATVEQFNSCYRDLTLLNAAVLEPLASVDVPPCEELTPAVAQAIQLQVFATVLVSASQLLEETGTNPLENEMSACDEIEMQCPDFAVPGGGLFGGMDMAPAQ